MFFESEYKKIKAVDASGLIDKLSSLPSDAWSQDLAIKHSLAKERKANTIFVLNIYPDEFDRVLAQESIKESHIKKMSGWNTLGLEVMALIDDVLKEYPPGGILLRAQLVLMPPDVRINPHRDSTHILKLAHRIHIPLVTNPDIRFSINFKQWYFETGYAFELNNRLIHSVYNASKADRIHLIFDYLPPENNYLGSLDRTDELVTKTYLESDFPSVLATTVIRGANKHESQGGIYLVDLKSETVRNMVDWKATEIDFDGRGRDRGLRGIAVGCSNIYATTSSELLVFDKRFNLVDTFSCAYLKHAHGICLRDDSLFVTSTGYDSVLKFNLQSNEFDQGWMIRRGADNQINVQTYEPQSNLGPQYGDSMHINSITLKDDRIFISGRRCSHIIELTDQQAQFLVPVPPGANNVMPYVNGFICNDTRNDQLRFSASEDDYFAMAVPKYDHSSLENIDFPNQVARQGFARGLCVFGQDLIIAGSSPATISVYSFSLRQRIRTINLTTDIRQTIGGLAIWNGDDSG